MFFDFNDEKTRKAYIADLIDDYFEWPKTVQARKTIFLSGIDIIKINPIIEAVNQITIIGYGDSGTLICFFNSLFQLLLPD